MLPLNCYRQELLSTGKAQLFIQHNRHRRRMSALIHTLLDDYPDMFVITQRRQNDPHDYRLIFTDAANEGCIWRVPHLYQTELETLDAAYQAMGDSLSGLGLDDPELRDLLHSIRCLHYEQIVVRPHPDNPYINVGWVAGKLRT